MIMGGRCRLGAVPNFSVRPERSGTEHPAESRAVEGWDAAKTRGLVHQRPAFRRSGVRTNGADLPWARWGLASIFIALTGHLMRTINVTAKQL